jgi:hypothetical protein
MKFQVITNYLVFENLQSKSNVYKEVKRGVTGLRVSTASLVLIHG